MGVDCHFLLQGIFPTQESNPGLLHCRQMLYHLSHQGSPKGKLEVVKQEMARVDVDILGISKLKWTGMGEFNSDDCGQEYLRRNGVAIMVNKRV